MLLVWELPQLTENCTREIYDITKSWCSWRWVHLNVSPGFVNGLRGFVDLFIWTERDTKVKGKGKRVIVLIYRCVCGCRFPRLFGRSSDNGRHRQRQAADSAHCHTWIPLWSSSLFKNTAIKPHTMKQMIHKHIMLLLITLLTVCR